MATTATIEAIGQPTSHPVLTKLDRCQSSTCSAQAFVLVEIPVKTSPEPLDVRYCAHHYNKHSEGLAAAEARIVHDDRHKINNKPTDPSQSAGF